MASTSKVLQDGATLSTRMVIEAEKGKKSLRAMGTTDFQLGSTAS